LTGDIFGNIFLNDSTSTLTFENASIYGNLNVSGNIFIIRYFYINQYFYHQNGNLTGSGSMNFGSNVHLNNGQLNFKRGDITMQGDVILDGSKVQVKETDKVNISGQLNVSSSNLVFDNVSSVELKGVETHSAEFVFKDISSVKIEQANFTQSKLTTSSKIEVTGSMDLTSSNVVMTMDSVLDVKGNAKIDDSTLVLTLDSINEVDKVNVLFSADKGIDGQFKSVEVKAPEGLVNECEKLKAQQSNEGNFLSIIVVKDNSGCNNGQVKDGASGVEIAMVVLAIVFGLGVVAAATILILLNERRKKQLILDLTKRGEKSESN